MNASFVRATVDSASVLDGWRALLGEANTADGCSPDGPRVDVGGHRKRDVPAIVYPRSREDIRRILLHAAETGSPVHPVSTGMNWGMGSRFPVTDGCTLVDLGRMNRIRTLDLERGYAVIEPGVTQRQLAEALKGTQWLLNLTTACADSGLVGNALDRGDGVIRQRGHDLLGFEAVLADGQTITTGGLDLDGRYHGLVAGPDLTQTVVQSNLAVVTAMAIALVPRPERTHLFSATFHRQSLTEVFDALVALKHRGLPTPATPRVLRYAMSPASGPYRWPGGVQADHFSVMVPLLGCRETVELAEHMLTESLGGIEGLASVRRIDAHATPEDDPLAAAAKLVRGIPSCDLVRVRLGSDCRDVDSGPLGWTALMPLLPVTPGSLRTALGLLQQAVDQYPTGVLVECGLDQHHTANMVVQIAFERTPEATARAHAMRMAAREKLIHAGFMPYRSNIDDAAEELTARGEAGRDLLNRIKGLTDPVDVITPGRFLRPQH